MSPQQFIRLIGVVLLTVGGRAAPENGNTGGLRTEPVRWNILFCFADDWGRHAGAYAAVDGRPSINDVLQTPNLDGVAREGALFRNAFVSAPSCTPCRSSLMLGRHFFNTGRGAILRNAIWDPTLSPFPLLLRDAGYHIGKTYKVWGPGIPPDAPFDRQNHAYEMAGQAPNNYSEEVTARLAAGLSLEAAKAEVLGQVRDNFSSFLSSRPEGQPWLYFFGPTNTHRLWTKGSGAALWNIDPEQLKGRLPARLPDVPEVREDVADYLGEVQAWDAYLGEIFDLLEATGESDHTLVVVSGDHGYPGFPGGKCDLYDDGTAVALLVRVPGQAGARVIDDFVSLPDLAPTFMEVAGVTPPAGVTARSILLLLRSGRDGQVEPDRTWVITGRERHVDVARENFLPYPMRALRIRDYLYVRNFAPERWPMGSPGRALSPDRLQLGELERSSRAGFADMDASPTKAWLISHREEEPWRSYFEQAFGRRPGEELYDLRRDPGQVRNVAADPDYAAALAQLSGQLTSILTEADDPRMSENPIFEYPPYTDPEPPELYDQTH